MSRGLHQLKLYLEVLLLDLEKCEVQFLCFSMSSRLFSFRSGLSGLDCFSAEPFMKGEARLENFWVLVVGGVTGSSAGCLSSAALQFPLR